MSSFVITGKNRLYGETAVQGAKNAVLPIMAAQVTVDGKSVLHRCPDLSDVTATVNVLEHLGCRVNREKNTLTVDSSGVSRCDIPDSLMREMRSSIIFLGAILARTGKAVLSTPGGCEIGLRPIDLHLDAMQKLGAVVSEGFGKIECEAPDGLRGAQIHLSFPSVGATENIMIAGATAKGETVIYNAAREPEISDLADFLNSCGADIRGAGDSTVVIRGVKKLYGCEHTIIPDRIVAATLMIASAVTGGRIKLNGVVPAHLYPVIHMLNEAGANIETDSQSIAVSLRGRPKAVKTIRTMPHPGFPTDIQAPTATLLSIARGTSVIIETIFESRYKYVGELIRLGAKIRVDGRMAVIEGVEQLEGTTVAAPDLRSGAALVTAGLCAEGVTVIKDIYHIERGYENLEGTLKSLEADIKRVNDDE